MTAELEFVVVDPSDRRAQQAVQAYLRELDERLPNGFDPAVSVSADDDELRRPRGCFVLGVMGESWVGCGAIKTLEPGVAEIKRMWIAPAVRGRGFGRRLLEALETQVLEMGIERVRLDTSDHLPEAIALYRRKGYQQTAPYNDNQYAAHWFEKRLVSAAARPDDSP